MVLFFTLKALQNFEYLKGIKIIKFQRWKSKKEWSKCPNTAPEPRGSEAVSWDLARSAQGCKSFF